jgi:nucleoside-diphosphate-sugar epimerase
MLNHALITGATGFLGGALALKLAAAGVRVRALVRTPNKADFLPPEIERFPGDVTDLDAMRRAAEGCDVVFHLAAAFGDAKTQIAVNVDGTRNTAEAAGQAGARRFVHVSSISVYGNNYTRDVTEAMPPAPGAQPYAVTKTQAEQIVRESAACHRMSYTILRPGMIYGPKSAVWTRYLFSLARLNPTPWIGSGQGSCFPIYIDDVTDALIAAADHPNADRQVFNVTPSPSVTWREFIGSYSRLAGHANWLPIPAPLLVPVGGIALLLSPPLSDGRDLPDMIRFVQRFITFKNDKARDLLGWQPQIDLLDGIARSADYLREIGLLQ